MKKRIIICLIICLVIITSVTLIYLKLHHNSSSNVNKEFASINENIVSETSEELIIETPENNFNTTIEENVVESNNNVDTKEKVEEITNETNTKEEAETVKKEPIIEKPKQVSNNTPKNTQTQKESTVQQPVIEEKPKESEKITENKDIVEEPAIKNEPKEDNKIKEEEVINKCSDNKHGIEVGNTKKWFNSKEQAIAEYDKEINLWGDKWVNDEIDDETYYKNCPDGYEIWSCPYCGKWTINYYY